MLDVDPGRCVTIADGRKRGTQSYRFYNEQGCGVAPSLVPRLHTLDRAFTLSVWLRQERSNAG